MLNGELAYSCNSLGELEAYRQSSMSYASYEKHYQVDWYGQKSIAEPELEPDNNIIFIPKVSRIE